MLDVLLIYCCSAFFGVQSSRVGVRCKRVVARSVRVSARCSRGGVWSIRVASRACMLRAGLERGREREREVGRGRAKKS